MKTIQYTNGDVDAVANALLDGKVIAFPTDTVFGLAVVYDHEAALESLKKAKGRPENKPIPTMVSSIEQMEKIAELDEEAIQLANAFMPGACTLILNKKAGIPEYVTNGFPTIGIRMPDDEFVLSLLDRCGKPLLVTSANLSDHPSGNNDKEVLAQLEGRIAGIVIGEAKGKQASTIIDMTGDTWNIVRSGPISEQDIKAVLEKGESE